MITAQYIKYTQEAEDYLAEKLWPHSATHPLKQQGQKIIDGLHREAGNLLRGIISRLDIKGYEELLAENEHLRAMLTWQPIETAPLDGTPILSSRIIRYEPYKKTVQRQMERSGRWQEHNGYGWDNCDEPAEWMPMERR